MNRKTAHYRAMVRNQVQDLLRYGEIVTTFGKAKKVQRAADKIISKARRQIPSQKPKVEAFFYNYRLFEKLWENAPERFENRERGFTRITKFQRPRKGDCTYMAKISLV